MLSNKKVIVSKTKTRYNQTRAMALMPVVNETKEPVGRSLVLVFKKLRQDKQRMWAVFSCILEIIKAVPT